MKVAMILLMFAWVPQWALASADCATHTYWWTSLSALAVAAGAAVSSVFLAVETNTVHSTLKQTSTQTPRQAADLSRLSDQVGRALHMEMFGAAMSVLEVAAVAGLFWANHYKHHRTSAALSMLYFTPAILSALLTGMGGGVVYQVCFTPGSCWDENGKWIFVQWLTAWGVFRGFAFVAPAIALFGTGCLVGDRDVNFFQ